MRTYNFRQIICTVAGVPVTGWGDSDGITVTRASDRYAKKVGISGEAARSRLNDDSAEIKISVLYTAGINDVLQGLVDADSAAPNGATFPVEIVDLNGNFLAFGAECWIKKAPDNVFGREVGNAEWMIDCAKWVDRQGSSRDSLIG